jgi:hypothetical protein
MAADNSATVWRPNIPPGAGEWLANRSTATPSAIIAKQIRAYALSPSAPRVCSDAEGDTPAVSWSAKPFANFRASSK